VNQQKKLVVLVGPTAVGKTAVALNVARYFNTAIVSADSRQIFREMTIGTAKPTPAELSMVPHHFINTHSIHDSYDAAQYGRDALNCIHKLFESHDHLVLCGGSGLYIKAVCEGFDEIPEVPAEIREQLVTEFQTAGLGNLQQKLKQLDPEHFENIDTQNPQRVIRALEVILGTGLSISSFHNNKKIKHDFHLVKIGLECTREVLYERINRRMDNMITEGLFDEAASLYANKHMNALQTVGYQEIFDFMDGKYDREETIRLLKRNSRRYAKRQLTWFHRDGEIIWMDPAKIDDIIAMVSNN